MNNNNAMDIIKTWKKRICEEEVSETQFDIELDKWITKFGKSEKIAADFIWSMFNRKVSSIATKNVSFMERYEILHKVYWDMINFLSSEERDTTHVRSSINRLYLLKVELEDKDSEFETTVEIIATKCCSECDTIDGKILSIEEATKLNLLPVKSCTRKSGCVCSYTTRFARNSDGRLKRKK